MCATQVESYHLTRNGGKIFVHRYLPSLHSKATIYIIAGITGINHNSEKDIIRILSCNENEVVTIHPRGTGLSEGKRGDIENIETFINDFIDIIESEISKKIKNQPIFLYGHSMSTAVLLAVADKLREIDGAILINPPYFQKRAKGMSPGFIQYFKYAYYLVFAKHTPVVNMVGDPTLMVNEEDRKEAAQRAIDPLLVKYFSMYYMMESQKLIKKMLLYCKNTKYPLLLIYGLKDNIVDKKGCDIIFENWKYPDKKYETIVNGSHGKSTVLLAKEIIQQWLKDKIKTC